jgi:hypothetical protein
LAGALGKLASDESSRTAMAEAAITHARSMSWERRVLGVLPLVEGINHGD